MKHSRNAMIWILLLSMLVSCTGTGGEANPTSAKTVRQTEETEKLDYDFAVEPADYHDETIRLLTGVHSEWEFMAEEGSGDVVEDAVYKRNLATEEHLGIHFEFSSMATYTGEAPLVLSTIYNGRCTVAYHKWN